MNVLFLCTGNSARSIVGEVLFNSLFAHKGKAFSAGSKPTGKVNPLALKMLEEYGHVASYVSSQNCTEYTQAPPQLILLSVFAPMRKKNAPYGQAKEPRSACTGLYLIQKTKKDFEAVYAALKEELLDYYS